jgi:citrate synthase
VRVTIACPVRVTTACRGRMAPGDRPTPPTEGSWMPGSTSDVSLEHPGGSLALPVKPATEGPTGIEVPKLLASTGMVTLDPGFVNTASCESAITYIDGDAGILRYRGYPIDELAENASFLEVAWLLIYGELPTDDELAGFKAKIRNHTMLHEDFREFFGGFPTEAHPMAVLSSAVSALSTFYQDSLNPFDPEHVEMSTVRLLAKMPTIAAYAYKKSIGQPFLYPDNSLGYVDNFLRMTFGVPAESYEVNPQMSKALNLLFLLHADHEQNCSTSTVRLVGSSNANLFVSVSAGVAALLGPLHGGANQAVLEMLEGIRADGGDVARFVQRVKDKEPGARLMGFGHRVYKNYDPRAAIVKKVARDVIASLEQHDPLLDLAVQLEEAALADDFFVERKLYPNVDFYTGVMYKAMGFPTGMFTVLFALGRLPGWIAQWREMIADPATKIGRPRQVYTGPPIRHYPA